jgi:hypothetical protein
MSTCQGLEKTCIGIYFSDQIWVIETEYLGWSILKSNYYQTLIDFELNLFSHGLIHCILQLSCLQIWILSTQEYVMAFWMKTITKSTQFCWSLYVPPKNYIKKKLLRCRRSADKQSAGYLKTHISHITYSKFGQLCTIF